MSSGVRLYVLDLGGVLVQSCNGIAGQEPGPAQRLPVSAFLIVHPAGKVLFDTGMDPDAINSHAIVWSDSIGEIRWQVMPEDLVVNRLAAIGLKPADIGFVVLSHLHRDHAGGVRLFPNAEVIVQRAELETEVAEDQRAFYPGVYQSSRLDGVLVGCSRPTRLIDGDIDLFGDGRILIVSTPGHSPGHQSILTRLDHTGDVLLVAAITCDQYPLQHLAWTEIDWCPVIARRSKDRLRGLRDCCALTICSHDPVSWPAIDLAPKYYD